MIERVRGGVVAREVPDAGLAPPPGAELFRFATVSDVHVGLEHFAFLPTVHDPLRGTPGIEPPSIRCLRAAVDEARAWGAQLLVVKGDLTQHGHVDEARRAMEAIGDVPVLVLRGNHEHQRSADDLLPVFGDAAVQGVRTHDVPGARIVVFDSTVPGHHRGSYDLHADDVVDAIAGAGPSILLTHHHPQPLRIAHHWPPGIRSDEAARFFDRVVAANPRVFMSTGHTHRHRRHEHGRLVITEVGSTQHFPGTWAGYAVHEGGVRQVVRRVAAPAAIAWTEATRRGVAGVWARWSVGRLEDRSFSITWPRSQARSAASDAGA